MSVIEVNAENFESEVLQSEIPVLADFNADWCGPCQAMKPVLENLAAETPGFKIVSINIDDEADLADEYDVLSIPCLVVFKGGTETDRLIGKTDPDSIRKLMEG